MPFTLAHPVAAIPLRRLGLPLDALVIGAMIPDLVLFAPLPVTYSQTHAPLGTVTVDLVLGAVLLAVWRCVLKAPLVDASPSWIRERLPSPAERPRDPRAIAASLALGALALVLGAWTHILWDAFTHDHGWVVQRVAALRALVDGVPVYFLAQYASSILGLIAIAWIVVRALGARAPQDRPRRRPRAARAVLLVPVVLAAATAGTVLGATWGRLGLRSVVFLLATWPVSIAVVGLLAACLVWWAAPRGPVSSAASDPGASVSS